MPFSKRSVDFGNPCTYLANIDDYVEMITNDLPGNSSQTHSQRNVECSSSTTASGSQLSTTGGSQSSLNGTNSHASVYFESCL